MAGLTIWRAWQVSGAGAESWQKGDIFTQSCFVGVLSAHACDSHVVKGCCESWVATSESEQRVGVRCVGSLDSECWSYIFIIQYMLRSLNFETLIKSSHTRIHTPALSSADRCFQPVWPFSGVPITGLPEGQPPAGPSAILIRSFLHSTEIVKPSCCSADPGLEEICTCSQSVVTLCLWALHNLLTCYRASVSFPVSLYTNISSVHVVRFMISLFQFINRYVISA